MIEKLKRNRNIYVWFTPGSTDGCLASATPDAVRRFTRQGDIFRQATLRDWMDAKDCKTIKK